MIFLTASHDSNIFISSVCLQIVLDSDDEEFEAEVPRPRAKAESAPVASPGLTLRRQLAISAAVIGAADQSSAEQLAAVAVFHDQFKKEGKGRSFSFLLGV